MTKSHRRIVLRSLAAWAGLAFLVSCAQEPPQPGFVRIFDGLTLSGWRPWPPDLADTWSVKDGSLRAAGVQDRLAYLVYEGDEDLADFEFRFSYRMLTDGNTGIEVRARVDPSGKRPLEGYHADLGHHGIGPSILGAWDFHFASRNEPACQRGTRLYIDSRGDGHRERIEGHLQPGDIRRRGWNSGHIIAEGNRLRFLINGRPSSEFTDGFGDRWLRRGLLALQMHDRGTVVHFRDLMLKVG